MSTATITEEKNSTRRQVWADSALVAITFVWGATFVLVRDVLEQVSPMLYLAARFMLGALAVAAVLVVTGRWRGLTMREMLWGALTGVSLWAGYGLQTSGLYGPHRTSASNAGFITGLSVVLVPVLGIFILRQVPGLWAWVGVALATLGLAMLSLNFDGGVYFNQGDVLVLGCAFAFAIEIVLIGRAAASSDPLRFTMVQVSVAGLLSGLSAAVFERPVPGLSLELWAAIAFLGLVATALAIIIQVTVQSFTTVVHTALIFTLEPVFAAIFGIALQGDRLGPIAIIGAVLILLGMLLGELSPGPRAETVSDG